jgi:ribose transport system permease protein
MSKKTGYFKRYAMTLLFPLGMYAVFALITLIIGNTSFFTGYTTEGIIHDTVENTIIALAIAIPLSGGRWDFGPGAIIMLGAIIGGNLGMQLHMGTFGVLLCCVAACMLLALIEAVFYVTLRVPNMIISRMISRESIRLTPRRRLLIVSSKGTPMRSAIFFHAR